jgi:hypothetical protein
VAAGVRVEDARAAASRAAGPLVGLRILEIGDVAMFKQAAPAVTELVWTGHRDDIEGVGRFTPFALRRLPALRRALARAEFDLVVGHPPADPPWRPTHVAMLLRRFGRGAPERVVRSFGSRLLLRTAPTPLAMVDLSDAPVIAAHNVALLDRARVYFKRELPEDPRMVVAAAPAGPITAGPGPRPTEWLAKVRPISLGVSPLRAAEIARATVSPAEKHVDVFFAGRLETSAVRRAGVAELRALARDGIRVDLASARLDRVEFYRRCGRAWITWSPAGYGWDCFRHYEAPLCGSVPLMNEPSIVRHAPLRAGEHALYYRAAPGELGRVVRAALADRPGLARIAAAAREHVRRHHMLERVCEHVVRSCLDG